MTAHLSDVTDPSADADDLIDASEVAEILGLSHRNSVSTYRTRYRDFPPGQPAPGGGRTRLWHRREVLQWRASFAARQGSGQSGSHPRLEDLVAATARLLLAHPGTDISIRQIAAEAGVAHSDLYRYAESKEQLVRLALARVVDEYRIGMPDGYEAMLAGMEQLYLGVADRAPAVRLIVAEAITNPDAPPGTRLALADIAEAIAAHRNEHGIDSPVSPEVVAACLGAMAFGLVALQGRWTQGLGVESLPPDEVAVVMRAILQV